MRSKSELEIGLRALLDLDPDKTGTMRAADEAGCILLALIPDPPPSEGEWTDIQNAMTRAESVPPNSTAMTRVSRLRAAERGRMLLRFYATNTARSSGGK
jgi:hypothetical protein